MTRQERIHLIHKLLARQRAGTVLEQRQQAVDEIVALWQKDIDEVWNNALRTRNEIMV